MIEFGAFAWVWTISGSAVAGVILRPFGLPEWIFAVAGAGLLSGLGFLPLAEVRTGIASGTDVYLFLAGMMLLAEIARREGLFSYFAAYAARWAKGSPRRLFALVYLVGTLVTVFLSNDATAVVLTPAVAAVARAAEARSPIPYLLVCAFVANAASFVLPISNPANLVVFGSEMPPLLEWLQRFSLASILSIVATFLVLRWTQREDLQGTTRADIVIPALSSGGRIAAAGVGIAAIVLLGASASGHDLGWPAAIAGFGTLGVVLLVERTSPWAAVKAVSWDTLLLVAGLFVIVRALELSGLERLLATALETAVAAAPDLSTFGVGVLAAFGTNLTNNLPLGLIAGSVVAGASVPERVVDAILVGIDIGPNLSVTGSLATILWLTALRREGLTFGAFRFLKLGFLVMPPALLLALAAIVLQPW
jgi:arsenical pump membrane protein